MRVKILIALMLAMFLCIVPVARAAADHRYVCPPCGLPCDSEVFDHPGNCPKCGMVLVDQEEAAAAAAAAPTRKKVAILIFTGVQIIDYTGPYEVFGAANCDVYTVAETKDPVTTVGGMTVVPKFTFADAPRPDVLVVPGGGINSALASPATLQWLRDVTPKTDQTMSVCNGAFILAKAGLLDGLSATTTAGNIERLRDEFPKIHVVDDRRYVDNGRIVTTGGLSAGIDGALHVVEKTFGQGRAQQVALAEEYPWSPESPYARARLADMNLYPYLDDVVESAGTWKLERTEGGTDHWRIVLRGTAAASASAVLEKFGQGLISKGGWKKAHSDAGAIAATTSNWKFTGRDGKAWNAKLAVRELRDQPHGVEVDLAIRRVG